ncbi:hypothetical protein [Novosphingobium aquimarinum]|uniref:hypothetical protein n=1 Tax=Novosphingobium aquimarinum TaxID=2682494 RepID=UPI0012EC6163|nr:hypothetical protein [Novosphingobium aquimarinum]
MGWLTAKGALGLVRWGWIAIVAALIAAAVLVIDSAIEDVIAVSKDQGATEQREGDLHETLNRTEEGNNARTEIEEGLGRADGRSRPVYDQCLRTARTPENCERFLPER